jgi:hypothetical protein
MRQQATSQGAARAGRLIGLLLLTALGAVFVLAPAHAQQTRVLIQIEGSQPVVEGEQFVAAVLVENVEHLAGFDFTIGYDAELLTPVGTGAPGATPPSGSEVTVEADDVGQFIVQNGERQDMICEMAKASPSAGTVRVSCVTAGPPLCLGGAAGASGSGVLGRVPFQSKGGGTTTLELVDSTLVLDDVADDCDREFKTVRIEHVREDAQVRLAGDGGGGVGTAVIVAAIVVAAVVVVAGGGALLWYRRRPT